MLPTSGTQKAMPHPLGSSRSHPAPQELISCPACLPGWWTSRIGTRPCSGVGLSLEPGTSTSLLIRFNSCTRQKMLDVSATSKLIFALRNRDEKKKWVQESINISNKACLCKHNYSNGYWHLLDDISVRKWWSTCSDILLSVTLSRTDCSHR